jgi:crotonobetainyl-CoA:carnitine CoA-transferase CaiB-like acyl-CoA transferase
MLSLTGFGYTEGPRSHYLAYGSTVCSFVGLTQAWGFSHGTHFDYVSEAHGLFGILAALAARDRSGLGTHIDLAEVEAAAAVMGPLMLDYAVNGHDPAPGGNGGNMVPWVLFSDVVPCRGDDRWLAVEAEDATDLRRLAELVGCPDPGQPGSPLDEQARLRLSAALRTWARPLTPQQAMRAMQRAGLAAGAVQDNEDVVCDPQHRERRFLHEMNHPDLGVAEYASSPYRLAKMPATIRRPTPRLGAHTIEILDEWLGMEPAEACAYGWPATGPRTAATEGQR